MIIDVDFGPEERYDQPRPEWGDGDGSRHIFLSDGWGDGDGNGLGDSRRYHRCEDPALLSYKWRKP